MFTRYGKGKIKLIDIMKKDFFFHRRCYVRPALNTMDWPEFFQVLCILYISKLQLKSWYGTKLPANMLVVEFHFLTK